MPGMLKKTDRQSSDQSLERFLEGILDDSDFEVDILVHSKQGNGFYYGVPCTVVKENDYPYGETSYSLNVWWSKADKREGNPPKDGFPNYPGCSEYKTYFNSMFFLNSYLEFRNVWHDEVAIYIFIHDDDNDNSNEMKELAKLWDRDR